MTIPQTCPHCGHPWHSINACVICDCDWYANRPGPQKDVPIEQEVLPPGVYRQLEKIIRAHGLERVVEAAFRIVFFKGAAKP